MTDLLAEQGLSDTINNMLIVQEDTKTIVMFFDFSLCQNCDLLVFLGELADRYKNCIRFYEGGKDDSLELCELLRIRKPNTCVTYTNGEENYRANLKRDGTFWNSILTL